MNHSAFARAAEIQKARTELATTCGYAQNLHIREYRDKVLGVVLEYASDAERQQIENFCCSILRRKIEKLEEEFKKL